MEIGDIIQTAAVSSLGNQAGVNVRHWRVLNKIAMGVDELVIANFFDSVLAPLYKGVLVDAARYEGVVAKRILPLPAGVPAISSTSAGPGQNTGDPLPRQVCGIITLRSIFAGRANRGRVYVQFPSEEVSDSTPKPSAFYLTQLAPLGAAYAQNHVIASGLNSNELVPVILHVATSTTTDIVVSVPRQKWATQRRRGDYGSPDVIGIG